MTFKVFFGKIMLLMKKIAYLVTFFFFTPILLAVSFISLISKSSVVAKADILVSPQGGTVLAAAIDENSYFSIEQTINTDDARPLLIKNYLEKYNSPLAPYADYIFKISQKYSLDYGLIVAIAQCESNICKKIPEGSYNCWGFGNGESKFRSWESAIEYVAKTLKEDYYDIGLVTPDQIMPKYVPPSVEKGGPWAKCVNQYLEELR